MDGAWRAAAAAGATPPRRVRSRRGRCGGGAPPTRDQDGEPPGRRGCHAGRGANVPVPAGRAGVCCRSGRWSGEAGGGGHWLLLPPLPSHTHPPSPSHAPPPLRGIPTPPPPPHSTAAAAWEAASQSQIRHPAVMGAWPGHRRDPRRPPLPVPNGHTRRARRTGRRCRTGTPRPPRPATAVRRPPHAPLPPPLRLCLCRRRARARGARGVARQRRPSRPAAATGCGTPAASPPLRGAAPAAGRYVALATLVCQVPFLSPPLPRAPPFPSSNRGGLDGRAVRRAAAPAAVGAARSGGGAMAGGLPGWPWPQRGPPRRRLRPHYGT